MCENRFKVSFVHSNKARRLSAAISANGIKVTVPPSVTQEEAEQFVKKNWQKITKIIEKQDVRLKTQGQNPGLLDENTELKTLTFTVKPQKTDRSNVHFRFEDEILSVEIPLDSDFKTDDTQKIVWNGIEYFLKKEARRIFSDRLQMLAQQHGFRYSSLKIQSSKGRWGSCSSSKKINLSCYLLLLPPHLIDYVILHELCHTKEMNHGEKFWAWMDKVTDGKAKSLRKEVKESKLPKMPK